MADGTSLMTKEGGMQENQPTIKTPTSILISNDGAFISMGYEAETRYSDPDTDKSSCHLFRNFKMILHGQKNITLNTVISSVSGTEWPAVDIFTHAIKYLSDHLIDTVNNASKSKITHEAIFWIITVPAIWSEQSKKFMREAAKRAGIHVEKADNVMLCLEPEAAALCCRRPNIAGFLHSIEDTISDTYIILDCGGGTVDTIAHSVTSKGDLKEILPASGGPWGGKYIDQEFLKVLDDIFGHGFISKFIYLYPQSWLDLISSFEQGKKSFNGEESSKIRVRLPWEFTNFYAERKERTICETIKSKYEDINFVQGSLILNKFVAEKLFSRVVNSIIAHVYKLLGTNELSSCRCIYMVGGFSENLYLQKRIRMENFSRDVHVLVPCGAQLAVLKGAVLYGHNQTEISKRIARFTYGYRIGDHFDPKIHREEYAYVDDEGVKMCDNVFEVLVKQGEVLDFGHRVTHVTIPSAHNATCSCIPLYSIDGPPKLPVQYTTDPEVEYIGEVKTYFLPCEQLKDNKARHIFIFGATELHVRSIHVASDKEFASSMDFISEACKQ